jgi:hypothetical protein
MQEQQKLAVQRHLYSISRVSISAEKFFDKLLQKNGG